MDSTNNLLAIVPMRTQPLHLGHINLIKALQRSFKKIRIIVGNQPISKDDPFSSKIRFSWWKQAIDVYGIKNTELKLGAHGLSKEKKFKIYTGNTNCSEPIVVSGNVAVLKYWDQLGIKILNVNDVPRITMDHIGLINTSLLTNFDGNSRLIRKAILLNQLEQYRDYLPKFVYKALFIY
ncbi:Cytidylyltransferase domain protein [Candidatus Magnetomorum sp. HK-1]|nr:Cytidylyltransferase domain protein [Candidatus Magnetomorum sp. HK-1]